MAERGSPDLNTTTGIVRAAGASVVGIAGVLLLLVASALAGLQSAPLRQAALDAFLAGINRGATKVEIGGLGGRWPTTLVLEHLAANDADGRWLSLDRVELEWRPTALLAGELHIVRLSAKGVDIPRAPEGATSPSVRGFDLPSLPLDVRIDTMAIENLAIGARVVDPLATATLARLDADARLAFTNNRFELDLSTRGKDGTAGKLDTHILFDRRDRTLDVRIVGDDGAPGKPGALAALAGLRGVERIAIEARGRSLDGRIEATARIDGGKAIVLVAGAEGRWDSTLDFEMRAEAEGSLVEHWLADLGRPRAASAIAHLRWDADDRLTFDGIALRAGSLALDGRAEIVAASSSRLHDFRADGTLAGLDRLLGVPGNAALAPLDWRIAAKLDGGKRTLQMADIVVAAKPGKLRYSGEAALDLAFAKGVVEADISDLAPFGVLVGRRLAGGAKIALSPFVREAGGDIAGDLVIEMRALSFGEEVLDRVVGGDLVVDGSIILPERGGFVLPSVTITPASGAYRLQGNVESGRTGILSGTAHFKTDDIARLLPDEDVAGALIVDTALSGTRDVPVATIEATLSAGGIAGFEARLATLDAVLRQGGEGPLAIRFDGPDGIATLDARLALPAEGGAAFRAVAVDLFGTPLAGEFEVSREGLFVGSIAGKAVSLHPLARAVGLPVDGRGDISLVASARAHRQDLSLAIAAPRLTLGGGAAVLERATLAATASNVTDGMTIDGTLSAASGLAGVTWFSSIGATAKGPLSALALSIDVAGTRETFKPEPVSLAARALYASGANELTVSELRFAIADGSIVLAGPATLDLHAGVSLRGAALALNGPSGSGHAEGDLTLTARTARLRLSAEDLPLELVAPFLLSQPAHGRATGRLELDSARGTGALEFRFDDVALAAADERARPAFDATLDGRWAKGRFDLSARAEGVSTKPFDLEASFPAIRDPDGLWPVLAPRGALSARLDWQGPVASLVALADVQNQQLNGDATVALSASGDISAPKVSGRATIANGVYENFDNGTVLRDLALSLEGRQSESLHFTLAANDSAKGRLTAEGDIRFAPGQPPAISIGATLANAHLVRMAEADIAFDGKLGLTGAAFPPTPEAPLTLKGDLSTTLARIRIPEKTERDLRTIEVVEINGLPTRHAAARKSSPLPLVLDLAVTTGTPAQVGGRGIDSLWTGTLTAKGPAEDPRIGGTLTSQRGTFDLAGKNFSLKKGTVRFLDRTPVDPDLDIVLDYARGDFSATVNVSGPSSAPEIALASSPSLPRDEILSRILFDKGPGELSALEAAQLANTLAQMTGRGGLGGGPGLLGTIQRALGLDQLQIGTAKSGGTTVAIGKYIQKGLYVGLEQGALASDSSVKVEIDVTSHVSVDTRVGQNATGEVGVNWTWDY